MFLQSHFVCFLQTCVERCLTRGVAGSGRSDDNLQTIERRLATYKTETLPIIKYYKELNLLQTIDANQPSGDVFEEVKKIFENLH